MHVKNSILDSTKKYLGIDAVITDFDLDILMAINNAISTLAQLGLSILDTISIEDNSYLWEDLNLPNGTINYVKTYIFLKVRIVFDPPENGLQLENIKNNLDEITWRIQARLMDEEEHLV